MLLKLLSQSSVIFRFTIFLKILINLVRILCFGTFYSAFVPWKNQVLKSVEKIRTCYMETDIPDVCNSAKLEKHDFIGFIMLWFPTFIWCSADIKNWIKCYFRQFFVLLCPTFLNSCMTETPQFNGNSHYSTLLLNY